MERIRTILSLYFKPLILHVINKKRINDPHTLDIYVDKLKDSSISLDDLKVINLPSDLSSDIINSISCIAIHRDELSEDNIILKYMIDDSIDIFGVYSYIDGLDDESDEFIKDIDSYIEFSCSNMIGESNALAGKIFSKMLYMARYNRSIVDVKSVSINNLLSLVMTDIDEVMNKSMVASNYRSKELLSIKLFIDDMLTEMDTPNDKVINDIQMILEKPYSNGAKLNMVYTLLSEPNNIDTEISRNVSYLCKTPEYIYMTNDSKLNEIKLLIDKYSK